MGSMDGPMTIPDFVLHNDGLDAFALDLVDGDPCDDDESNECLRMLVRDCWLTVAINAMPETWS